MADELGDRLMSVFQFMYKAYGPQGWWPADSAFEVIVGAILTQSVSWQNVEKAIDALKAQGLISPQSIRKISRKRLAAVIRPSGYYNAKTAKLKAFAVHLAAYDDDLEVFFAKDLTSLRGELLSIFGIGEETADSILLYAADKASFVVDAFTRRVIDRLGLAPEQKTYEKYQALFQDNLSHDVGLFKEFHALLVRLAKHHCLKREPQCWTCPLASYCPTGLARMSAS